MSHFPATTLFFLSAFIGMTACVSAHLGDSPFKITTKRDDDKVDVRVEEDTAHFLIQSPVGISQAIIERRGNKWPTTMRLHFQLKGLEKFKVTNGMTTLEASVSSQNGKVRLWMDGKEQSLLDSKHPYWMEIRMIGKDGDPVKSVPLKNGYFEMQLPKALFEDNPTSITINWIDFYR